MQILKIELRNKILSTAENIFYKNGFKDTTTRSIANEVGISVSNLYLYYKNKEAIFYGVTDGFYDYFINNFKAFLNNHDKNSEIYFDISQAFQNIIKNDQKKFVIIADKSQGTKYEDFKEKIIRILNSHMKSQANDFGEDELIIYILAKNFIEGIIEIAKNYNKNNLWLEKSINTLVCYHMNGMKHLC